LFTGVAPKDRVDDSFDDNPGERRRTSANRRFE
jgi:hypothetical protein